MNSSFKKKLQATVKRTQVGVPKQEAKLHRTLIAALRRSPIQNGVRRVICSELDVWHGVADVVVATVNGGMGWAEVFSPSGLECLNLTTAKLLAKLRFGSYKSIMEISKLTGYSGRTVLLHLRSLEQAGLIRRRGLNVKLLRSTKSPFLAVDAFEVKVSDWKHALYQATHYRSFANRSSVALPDAKARSVMVHKDLFKRFGIGLVGIKSPATLNWYVRPTKRTPFSASRMLLSSVQILKRKESRALRVS